MLTGSRTPERLGSALSTIVLAVLACATHASAQQDTSNPFGIQSRARAAERMIVLAVQQGISSLPPTSGQSFAYRFDPSVSTFVASTRMGPTSFRSPVGVGAGKFSVRLATSFFELDETFGPIDYRIVGENFADPPGFVTRFGLDANATVGLFNLAANYGLTERIELNFNLPVVVVHARASEIFLSQDPQTSSIGALPRDVSLDAAIDAGILSIVEREFSDIALAGGKSVEFDDDARAGVGRISIGTKVSLLRSERVQVAFSPEFFFPSPSEDELSGSESAAILPRLVSQLLISEASRLHVDVGYDGDFERAELRRFTWNAGSSIALTQRPWGGGDEPALTFDFGVGGSEFEEGIEWTPNTASFIDANGSPASIRALGNNELGNTFVDFLGGIKVRLNDRAVVSGAVNVPLNDEGFRADAVGTFALEYYF